MARFYPSPLFWVARCIDREKTAALGFNPTKKTATSRYSSHVAFPPQGMCFRPSDDSLILTLCSVREFRVQNGQVRALAEGGCPPIDRGPLGVGLGPPRVDDGHRILPLWRHRGLRRGHGSLRRRRGRPSTFARATASLLLLHSLSGLSNRRLGGAFVGPAQRLRGLAAPRRHSLRPVPARGNDIAARLDQLVVAARASKPFIIPIQPSVVRA
jgi:hypothetical protein